MSHQHDEGVNIDVVHHVDTEHPNGPLRIPGENVQQLWERHANWHDSGRMDRVTSMLHPLAATRAGFMVSMDEAREEMRQDNDLINNPAHYGGKDNPYEVIKVIEAWGLDFRLGTVVKYIGRAGKKDDELQDLEKAAFYLNRAIEKLKKERDAQGPA